tara:strand:- start:736 stop:975 length:240 start_codon:yes stop_codon:yes gene_type:complete
MNFKATALRSLMLNAEKDAAEATTSLEIMFNHPAGIGDHSTDDLHRNLNEALSKLADAEDRIETLKRNFGPWFPLDENE